MKTLTLILIDCSCFHQIRILNIIYNRSRVFQWFFMKCFYSDSPQAQFSIFSLDSCVKMTSHPHLWILAVLCANRAHVLGQGLVTAAVSGHQEEGVAQQTVVCSGQQLLAREGIRVATPDVHDGVPVAVREGKNSLKCSADTRKTSYRNYHLLINTVSSQL